MLTKIEISTCYCSKSKKIDWTIDLFGVLQTKPQINFLLTSIECLISEVELYPQGNWHILIGQDSCHSLYSHEQTESDTDNWPNHLVEVSDTYLLSKLLTEVRSTISIMVKQNVVQFSRLWTPLKIQMFANGPVKGISSYNLLRGLLTSRPHSHMFSELQRKIHYVKKNLYCWWKFVLCC